MRRMFSLFVLAVVTLSIGADSPPPAVTVSTVTYDGLLEQVKKLKGKVVVIDCWADYCIPCKKEFPKLVQLHKQHAKNGMEAVSLNLDEAEDGLKEKVLAFLKNKQATFTNLMLDEKPEVWQKKFQIVGPPLVMVFNRKGELFKKYVDKDVDYAEIEKLVIKLLNE